MWGTFFVKAADTGAKMMDRKVALSVAVGTALALGVSASQAESYGPYPITLLGYSGEKKNSVAYTGQVAAS